MVETKAEHLQGKQYLPSSKRPHLNLFLAKFAYLNTPAEFILFFCLFDVIQQNDSYFCY